MLISGFKYEKIILSKILKKKIFFFNNSKKCLYWANTGKTTAINPSEYKYVKQYKKQNKTKLGGIIVNGRLVNKYGISRSFSQRRFIKKRIRRWYIDVRKQYFKALLKFRGGRIIFRKKLLNRWLYAQKPIKRYLKYTRTKKLRRVAKKHFLAYGRFTNRWDSWILREVGFIYTKKKRLFFTKGRPKFRCLNRRYKYKNFRYRKFKKVRLRFKFKKAWKWSNKFKKMFIFNKFIKLRKLYLQKLAFKKHTQKTKYVRWISWLNNPISLLFPLKLIPFWKRALIMLLKRQLHVNNRPASWRTNVNKFDILSFGIRSVWYPFKLGYITKLRKTKVPHVQFLHNLLWDRRFKLFVKHNNYKLSTIREDLQFNYYYSNILFLQ